MTPSELFKPYTGMTVEGSTEEERAEIYDLLLEKGIARTKYEISRCVAKENGFVFYEHNGVIKAYPMHTPESMITNIPFNEFKQLIEKL